MRLQIHCHSGFNRYSKKKVLLVFWKQHTESKCQWLSKQVGVLLVTGFLLYFFFYVSMLWKFIFYSSIFFSVPDADQSALTLDATYMYLLRILIGSLRCLRPL